MTSFKPLRRKGTESVLFRPVSYKKRYCPRKRLPRKVLCIIQNRAESCLLPKTTLVDDRQGYEYDSEIKQMTVFRIEDHPRANIFFLGFDDDTEALKSAYDLTLFEADDPRGHHGLKIKPRADSDEEAYFIEANLYLRDEDYLPYRIHIVNDSESQLYIEVSEISPQAYQDLNSARFFVPEGVKIIENERVIETVETGGRHVPMESQRALVEEKELPAEVPDIVEVTHGNKETDD